MSSSIENFNKVALNPSKYPTDHSLFSRPYYLHESFGRPNQLDAECSYLSVMD
jgi:hypothetical protein